MDAREQTWAALMRAGRGGDGAAYQRLLGEIADPLRRLVRARLSRAGLAGAEAEDVVQEVLIGLHAKRHTWDADRPFLPWLNAIAHYKLADAARRMRREARRRVDVEPGDWAELFAAEAVDLDRAAEDVERHIGRLPATQGTVLRALAVEGISVRATAERLRTSEGVVRMTLHRALERVAASVQGVSARGATAPAAAAPARGDAT